MKSTLMTAAALLLAWPAASQTIATPVSYAQMASVDAAKQMLERINSAPIEICRPDEAARAGDARPCGSRRSSARFDRGEPQRDSAAMLLFLAQRPRR